MIWMLGKVEKNVQSVKFELRTEIDAVRDQIRGSWLVPVESTTFLVVDEQKCESLKNLKDNE